jgi:P4 family phage/plasmid primase-like protien
MSRAPLKLVSEEPLDLLSQHRDKLFTGSAILPEIAAERGYRSIEDEIELSRPPYNFSPNQAEQVPALLIPIWGVTGSPRSYGFRPDMPIVGANGKLRKYQMPRGGQVVVDVPPRVYRSGVLDDPRRELWITESPIKADAAVSQGLDCIAIWGVWTWRARTKADGIAVLPDFEKIAMLHRGTQERRRIYFVFDSDTRTNDKVNYARARLVRWLRYLDASVRIIDLPLDKHGAKQGLDDFFANGGTVEWLRGHAIPADDQRQFVEKDDFRFTDDGNAERFQWLMREHVRAIDGGRDWLIWRGDRWDAAVDEDMLALAQEVPLYVEEQAQLLPSTVAEGETISPRAARIAQARKLESLPVKQRMITSSRPLLRLRSEELDSDPWLFNCANGTINLKTGEHYPHRSSDLITDISPVTYIPGHTDERWDRFLREATEEDADFAALLQRLSGMMLSGDTAGFEGFFYAYGGTATGKSTFFDALRGAWGDYGTIIDVKSLLRAQSSGAGGDVPRPDLVRADGKRALFAVEAERGAQMAEALVKGATGGSQEIVVRDLYAKAGDTRPLRLGTLLIAANERIRVASTEEAIWRRLWTLPFMHSVVQKPDVTLKPYLRDPRRGGRAVLAWAVEGCLLWQNEGRKLSRPAVVDHANLAYREEMTPWLGWKEGVLTGGDQHIHLRDLQASLLSWCEDRGVTIPDRRVYSDRTFGAWVKANFTIYGTRNSGGTIYDGIGLPEEEIERARAWRERGGGR